MSVAEEFEMLSNEWAEHCQRTRFSSRTQDYLDHPAYRQLIELGPPAVPLIMERYATDHRVPWEFVVQEITGTTMIDDPERLDAKAAARRRLQWWEQARTQYDAAAKN